MARLSVRIYSLAKTIADGLKYRKKIGLDLAMAPQDCIAQRKCGRERLQHFAKISHVKKSVGS
jgi:hypothetical protein